MTTTDESFSVWIAGEQIEGTDIGLTCIRINTPNGPIRLTAEEAASLSGALAAAVDCERRMRLSDEDAINPFLDPYPWEPEPALTVTVYGLPAAQGSKAYAGHRRNRASGRVSAVLVEQSKRVKPWRKAVADATRAALIEADIIQSDPYGISLQPLHGPIRVDAVFTMKKPTSAPKRTRTYPSVSPDQDKVLRSTFDALTQAGAWEDDGRVIQINSIQCYPGEHPEALPEPGALIRLYTLTGAES